MIYKRDPNALQSIVIIKAEDKYIATARINNDRDDFMVALTNKEALYSLIEGKIKRFR